MPIEIEAPELQEILNADLGKRKIKPYKLINGTQKNPYKVGTRNIWQLSSKGTCSPKTYCIMQEHFKNNPI